MKRNHSGKEEEEKKKADEKKLQQGGKRNYREKEKKDGRANLKYLKNGYFYGFCYIDRK